MIYGKNSNVALFKAAQRRFGNWRTAVRAAGIDYARVRLVPMYPTKEDVLSAIKQRGRRKLPLNTGNMLKGRHRNPTLWRVAAEKFGSWSAALKTAGYHFDQIRKNRAKYFSPQTVVREIRRRKKAGLTLIYSKVAKRPKPDYTLISRAEKWFGTWSAAIKAAGYRYKDMQAQEKK